MPEVDPPGGLIMSFRSCLVAIAVLFACPMFARAQVFGNNALFEPEISVVNSGAKLDAQATVSADRKYVTLTMQPQNAQLLALRTFQFQAGGNNPVLPGGVVGGVNPVIGGPQGNVIPQGLNAPVRLAPGNGGAILLKRGITPLVVRN
jgi:hypothetical protein